MNFWQTTATTFCLITGSVYDSQHHPLTAVKVHLLSADRKDLTSETDSAGRYQFRVQPGTYTLRIDGAATTVTAKPDKPTNADLTAAPTFFDEPQYKTAGVTDYTYQGGHGSDTVFRSSETLAKALEEDNETPLNEPEMEIYRKGTHLLNHKKVREAAEVFQTGTKQFPRSTRMLLGMASACYAEGAFDEAAQWFYRATDVDPSNPKPYLFLGRVRARQITESKGYRERMARFVKLQPKNALANYYYGSTLPDESAIEPLQKAVKLDPNLALGHLRLGVIAAQQHHLSDAIRHYQAAAVADPNLAEAHYRLSEVYRISGEADKAKAELAVFQRLSREQRQAQ